MRFFCSLLIVIFFNHCSFDDKSGIWKNDNVTSQKNNNVFKDFKNINLSNKSFQKEIPIEKNFKFKKLISIENYSWNDINYNQNNNLKNFIYNENFKLTFKSKKISKYKVENNLLLEENNIILTDERGNIFTFSINENKIISKYNFYRKKYKKIKKKLNIVLENELLYVSDNLGYFYAYNYLENKILWAKKHDVAFRSNIKIYKDKIITSNQNNSLFFFNKRDGKTLTVIPTEETVVKNRFENNLSLNGEFVFFLNTFGSLYAIDNDSMRIAWFINLNQSLDLNPNNLFVGNQIVANKDKLSVSSNEYSYIINQNTGSILYKKNFTSDLKSIFIEDYLFTITKNKYLIALNIRNGKLIYSYDLNQKIADFLNSKKKDAIFKDFMILNSKIVIFLENSFILILNIEGNLEQIKKLPMKIKSSPIIIDKSIIYLDKKNRITIIN